MTSHPHLVLVLVVLASLCTACRSSTNGAEDGSLTATCDGRRVHYIDRGSGDVPLVFVHGWAGLADLWWKQLDGFADRRRIALDLPGHGASDSLDGEATVEQYARAVLAVLDAAHVQRAVLVGHSNGAPVVCETSRLAPERVAALVFVDGGLRGFFETRAEAEPFLAPMRGADYRDAVARAFVDPMLAPMHDAAERQRVRETMLATRQDTMIASLAAVADPAVWKPDLVAVPVLHVLAKSKFWSEEYRAFASRIAPRSEWVELDHVSHFVMIDVPERFESEVRAFLARHAL